jgi:hypothetical protein
MDSSSMDLELARPSSPPRRTAGREGGGARVEARESPPPASSGSPMTPLGTQGVSADGPGVTQTDRPKSPPRSGTPSVRPTSSSLSGKGPTAGIPPRSQQYPKARSPSAHQWTTEPFGFGSRGCRFGFPTPSSTFGVDRDQTAAVIYKSIRVAAPQAIQPRVHVYKSAAAEDHSISSLVVSQKLAAAAERREKVMCSRPASGTGVRLRFRPQQDPLNQGPGSYLPERLDIRLRATTPLGSVSGSPSSPSLWNPTGSRPPSANSLLLGGSHNFSGTQSPTDQGQGYNSMFNGGNLTGLPPRPTTATSDASALGLRQRSPTSEAGIETPLPPAEGVGSSTRPVSRASTRGSHHRRIGAASAFATAVVDVTASPSRSYQLSPERFHYRPDSASCSDVWKLPFAGKARLKEGPPNAFTLASDKVASRDGLTNFKFTRTKLSMHCSAPEQQLSSTRPLTYLAPEPQLRPTHNRLIAGDTRKVNAI